MTVRDTRAYVARIRLARKLRAQGEEIEAELRELKARIVEDFGREGIERLLVDEVPCVVVKATERRLDTTRLKAEAPEIYTQFLGAPTERISVRL